MYLLLILIILILWLWILIYKFYQIYKSYSPIISSDKNLLGIGVAHKFLGDTESILKSLQEISLEATEKGGFLKAWLGPLPFIVVSDGAIINTILRNHLEKDDLYKILRTATGNGSIFAQESIWKCRRKTMLSVLQPKFVRKHFDSVLKRSIVMCETIATDTINKTTVNIGPHLNSFSFNLILCACIGKDMYTTQEDRKLFYECLILIKNYITLRCSHIWLHSDLLCRFQRTYHVIENHKKYLYGLLEQIIEKKKQEVRDYVEQFSIGSLKPETRMTFFELFLSLSKRKNEKEYNNLELKEELLTLIVAATDTTAVVITFTLKLLAKYPLIQDKVYAELCAAFQDQDMLPNSREDLAKLEYTERVINEVMRLFPPGAFILRKTKQEISLESGVAFPKNSRILVSIWGLHRNKKFWGEDAEEFDPDRFLPERYSKVPSGSFIPFSSGPRNCAGAGYAMMSIKTVLSVILKTFKIVPDPEKGAIPHLRAKIEITLTPVDGTVKLAKRC